jgi:16S rRNA (cytosine1402-N4)-methyltransferase
VRSLSIRAVEDPYSALFHDLSGRNPEDTLCVGGLRTREPLPIQGDFVMSNQFAHQPVMVREVVDIFSRIPAGVVIDATLGGAGHAEALLRSRDDISLLGIDQDENAIAAAEIRLSEFGSRVEIVRGRFDSINEIAKQHASEPIVGVLFDLGVSSHQFDVAERGFSYRLDGPLDMRMDQRNPLTAADIVNNWAAEDLVALFRENGERFAVPITSAIVTNRPFRTTTELVDVIREAIPARARRTEGHPARHVFQALRIAVNDELNVLRRGIEGALSLVVPGGRIVSLAYHSGEDRLVKKLFAEAASGGCVCPPGMPCVCGAVPTAKLLNRGARKPSNEEVEANPRSKAARLRAVELLDVSGGSRSGFKGE